MKIDKSNINQFIKGPIMDCFDYGITKIEFIPEYITELNCWNNRLTSLPELPDGLIELHCYDNQLTSLLPLGDHSVIPKLPDGLIELDCSYNELTHLPLLPNLEYLCCYHNPLINKPTGLLSNWIIQHNKSINRYYRLKQLLNDNR